MWSANAVAWFANSTTVPLYTGSSQVLFQSKKDLSPQSWTSKRHSRSQQTLEAQLATNCLNADANRLTRSLLNHCSADTSDCNYICEFH